MKKVSVLVLLAIVISTLSMAAISTTVVRLTMINKSGEDVYMKLEGSDLTEAFYYLTVPSGDRDNPTVKVFTIMSDLYQRTTWQCGVKSTGTLLVDGNIRLTFTPCGQMACKWSCLDKGIGTCPIELWGCKDTPTLVVTAHRYAGEPRMEKVTYFKYVKMNSKVYWSIADSYEGWWSFGCGLWSYDIATYKLPYGCAWRYQY